MSTEEDREALALILDQHDPEGGVFRDDLDADLSWWYPQAEAILSAGFHRAPAPAPDVQALIDELRAEGKAWREEVGEMPIFDRAADALEAARGARE